MFGSPAFALAWLVPALVAPAVAHGGPPPESAPRPAGAAVPRVGWTACGPRLECARVRVSLDWGRHGGKKIELAVIRHLAAGPGPRIGSLFFTPGGPGDSGVGAVTERGDGLDALSGGRFDVVSWDPRGSGGSASVSCFQGPGQRARFWNGASVPTTPRAEGATSPRPRPSPDAAEPGTSGSSRTSRPWTRCGTSTTCAAWSVIRS